MIGVSKLRSKTYRYLADGHDENKKRKTHKKCAIKEKLNFEDYKHCLEATQLENKINKLEKNKWMIIVIKKIKKNSKNNSLILKSKQIFRYEKHNVFTEEVNKIALSANGDKRIQSIDSIET